MSTRYRIMDEPRPGPLAAWAVDPLWPFLALMMAGPWLGFPWFLFNGLAIGSARQKREVAWIAGGWLTLAALYAGLFVLAEALKLGRFELGYLRFGPIVWLMICGYALHFSQGRSAQLFAHFGGRLRQGWWVAILGGLVGREQVAAALEKLPAGWFLKLVMA